MRHILFSSANFRFTSLSLSLKINFLLHSLPAATALPIIVCFVCPDYIILSLRRICFFFSFVSWSSFWFIAYIIIFALVMSLFRSLSLHRIRCFSNILFKADLLVSLFPSHSHFVDSLAASRSTARSDNLTENVKFILTSECTIKVIHMHWIDDWMPTETTRVLHINIYSFYLFVQLRRARELATTTTHVCQLAKDEDGTVCATFRHVCVSWSAVAAASSRTPFRDMWNCFSDCYWMAINLFSEFDIPVDLCLFDQKPRGQLIAHHTHELKALSIDFDLNGIQIHKWNAENYI